MNTDTVSLSQSAVEPNPKWVSQWERQMAWSATFGNRRQLAWPYSTTRLDEVVGEPPRWRAQLAEVFTGLGDPVVVCLDLAALFLAVAALVAITAVAVTGGSAVNVAAAVGFSACLLTLYVGNAITRLAPNTRLARWTASIDEVGLSLLAMATLVPLALVTIGGDLGAMLLVGAVTFATTILLRRRSRTARRRVGIGVASAVWAMTLAAVWTGAAPLAAWLWLSAGIVVHLATHSTTALTRLSVIAAGACHFTAAVYLLA
jgi:hypothetical protein